MYINLHCSSGPHESKTTEDHRGSRLLLKDKLLLMGWQRQKKHYTQILEKAKVPTLNMWITEITTPHLECIRHLHIHKYHFWTRGLHLFQSLNTQADVEHQEVLGVRLAWFLLLFLYSVIMNYEIGVNVSIRTQCHHTAQWKIFEYKRTSQNRF